MTVPVPQLDAAVGRMQVFSTSPQSLGADPGTYRNQVAEVARWSERAGCVGILVYTDNGILDPWLVAQTIIENTEALAPLVAVQPVYMHPYSVAKMVTSLAFLHGRRVCLNMVAGGFKNDLTALNDLTPHDQRYERLIEYTTIIRSLLECEGPLTFSGRFYSVDRLALKPPLPRALVPAILVSGSSEAGVSAARSTGAIAVKYPEPPGQCRADSDGAPGMQFGIRIGIIARASADQAWTVAHQRFPEDRRGRLMHELAMKVSDSEWHKQLSRLGTVEEGAYWLGPFETSKSNCPYLVGAYEDVAREVAAYRQAGYGTCILDIPPSEEELDHIGIVLEQAAGKAAVL